MAVPDQRRDKHLVLVVDDDVSVRILERASLENSGFAVEEAEDGATALSTFKRVHPDAVLLDVMMPEMDGFTVCEEIRKLTGGDLTPVFMVTGLDDLDSINRAFKVGATDFIAKPINWRTLGHHVKYMLRASHAFSRLRNSESRNRALLNAIPDMMFRISGGGVFLEYNGQNKTGLLVAPEEFMGKRLDEVMPRDVSDKAMHHVKQALHTGDIQSFEYQLLMGDTTRYYEARLVVCGEEEVLAVVRDITERTKSEKEISRLAYYDSLTGLPNRVLFKDRLEQAITWTQRYGTKLGIMFLDIDHFKRINDTLGHNIGDLLLKGVAGRLKTCLRRTDYLTRNGSEKGRATVARMGGDEFTIIVTGVNNTYDLSRIGQRVCDIFSQPFVIGSHEIFVTASIGITIYPIDSDDVDVLLKNADTAMYHAKDKGRDNFQFYAESMNIAAVERFTMTNQIRKALSGNEFRLHYQPKLDARTGKVVGVEALVRWAHPERGLLLPDSFIPIAEETSTIIPIGEWILREACAQCKAWESSGLPPVSVAVNISSIQFMQKNFAKTVKKILAESGLDPRLLELELTESLIMEHAESTIATLSELKAMGLQISIDDFGTGYSSLSYLKRFPLNTLKIDKSFVRDVNDDQDSGAIVKAIIAMAHHLNLSVIAEGVETDKELEFLRFHGCDQIQGFLFSVPLPPEDITRMLREDETGNEADYPCVQEEQKTHELR